MPARTDNFQKFVKQKKGSAIKEEIKQNKKKEKKERAAAIDAHYERKRAERVAQRQPVTGAPTPGRTAKFAAIKKEGAVAKTGRPNKYPKNNTGNQDSNKGKPGSFAPRSSEAHRPKKVMYGLQQAQNNKTPQGKKVMKDAYPSKAGEASAARASSPGKHPKKSSGPRIGKTKAPAWRPPAKEGAPAAKPSAVDAHIAKETLPARVKKSLPVAIPKNAANITIGHRGVEGTSGEQMPLNKYIAHGGICSRRDAAILVKEGKVTVNDTPATDPGMKVLPTDVVKVGNKKITPSRNFVYILLNKPKDYITTSDDPQGRKTVLDLVRSATDERVYPVGRLDRNTSGVLLLTNDGELAQKLSHPKHEVKKVYEVKLDRALTRGDLDMIASGITLEDVFVAPDVIAYADAKDKSIIGIEIHSGRNRIVRRIFEHLKYDVKGLDRVMYAGLTKKDVQRGNWRFLKDKEIRILKFMNQSFVKIRE